MNVYLLKTEFIKKDDLAPNIERVRRLYGWKQTNTEGLFTSPHDVYDHFTRFAESFHRSEDPTIDVDKSEYVQASDYETLLRNCDDFCEVVFGKKVTSEYVREWIVQVLPLDLKGKKIIYRIEQNDNSGVCRLLHLDGTYDFPSQDEVDNVISYKQKNYIYNVYKDEPRFVVTRHLVPHIPHQKK